MIIHYNLKSETLKKLSNFSWWIQAANTDVSKNTFKKLLSDLDTICLQLESVGDNKTNLLERINSLCANSAKEYQAEDRKNHKSIKDLTELEHEHRRQVWDFMNELKACDWLNKNSFSNIKIIPTQRKKTPDIKAEKDTTNYYIEVKTLHEPREEERMLMDKKMLVMPVETNYHESLKKKIQSFYDDAVKKFKSVDALNKILIIFYSLSISAYLTNDKDKRNLDSILGKHYFNELESKGNMKIIKLDNV